MKSPPRFINQEGTRIPGVAHRLSIFVALSLSAAVQHAQAATVRTVALSDQPAPGTPSGANYRGFNRFYYALNDAGQVAFLGYLTLTNGGVSGLNNEGIWSEGAGSLALVARKGSHAPGTPIDVKFFNFALPVLNNAGQTAFWAGLIDRSFVTNVHQGIWSEGSGTHGPSDAAEDHAGSTSTPPTPAWASSTARCSLPTAPA